MDIGNCYLRLMRSMVGGYNHFELRNYARAYDLPDNGTQKGFKKGEPNPSMLFVRNWIDGLNL